jgi:hypothetical protein
MINVREVEDKDILPLAEFLPSGFPYTTKEFWLSLFKFWWTSNPAYSDYMPRGWVLEKDSSITGFIGNIPVRFLVRGEVKIASASNSWYADPSVRGINSLRLFNEYLKQKYVSLFLFKEEDDEPLMNILSRYKFEKFILPMSQKEYVYIIDKKKVNCVVSTFLFNNTIPKLSLLKECSLRMGFVFFAYLYQKQIVPKELYICSFCISCNDSFQRLWEKHLDPHDITLSRDTETLNWLYFSSGRTYKRVVIRCHRSGDKNLAGYMVFDLIQKLPNMNNLKLVDMCIDDNDPRVLESLTSFAIQTGKQLNAALLILWANSPESENYFRSAMTMRRNAQYPRYFRFSDLTEKNPDTDHICLPMIYPPQ